MRTAILCLLLLVTASVVFAGQSPDATTPSLNRLDLVALMTTAALGSRRLWRLRK